MEEQRETKGGQRAGYVIKIEREWERTAAAVREREEEREAEKKRKREIKGGKTEKMESSERRMRETVLISKIKANV